jgi:translation initiation factor IF-1
MAIVAAVAVATNRYFIFWRRSSDDRAPLSTFERTAPRSGRHRESGPARNNVSLELDNNHLVLAVISGKMRKKFVRLTAGDRVKMEMSPYDVDKARITWRLR